MRAGLNLLNGFSFLKAKAVFCSVGWIQTVNNNLNCSAEGKGFTSCEKLLWNYPILCQKYTAFWALHGFMEQIWARDLEGVGPVRDWFNCSHLLSKTGWREYWNHRVIWVGRDLKDPSWALLGQIQAQRWGRRHSTAVQPPLFVWIVTTLFTLSINIPLAQGINKALDDIFQMVS